MLIAQDTHTREREWRKWLFYLHSGRDAHGTILFRTTNLTNILIKPENKLRRVMQYMIIQLNKSIPNLSRNGRIQSTENAPASQL